MNTSLLQLHLSQAKRSLRNSANNNYLDSRKSAYQSKLEELLINIEQEDLGSLDDSGKQLRKEFIDFIFSSIEYLDGSLFTSIPFELTFCLESALEDWIPSASNVYIITTALRPELFSFSLSKIADQFGQINALYGINFSFELIRISLSKYLAHDYLYNIVLYHELGHFVDHNYKISKIILDWLFLRLDWTNSNSQRFALQLYFPYLFDEEANLAADKLNDPTIARIAESHIMEYFADLFAAQYIGRCSEEILRYLSHPNVENASYSHPSPNNRIQLVDDFLNSRSNPLIDLINQVASTRSGTSLAIRSKMVATSDFFKLIPAELTEIAEVHGIFTAAWEVYQGDHSRFQSENSMANELNALEVYSIVNNLAEKSIGNFIVKKSFDEH